MENTRGHFVTRATLEAIEHDLEELMATGNTSRSDDLLNSMHDELMKYKKRAEAAEDTIKVSNARTAILERDLDALDASLQAQKRLTATEVTKIETDKEELKRLLRAAQAETARLRQGSSKGKDQPDQAKVAAEEVTRLNNLLQQANAAALKAKAQVDILQKEKISLMKAKADEEAIRARMEKVSFSDAVKAKLEPTKVPLPPSSFVGKKLFTEGMRTMAAEYMTLNREAYREKAFKLMELAKDADPKNALGVKKLMGLLFMKVKKMPQSERKKLEPVFVHAYDFLVSKTGPPLGAFKKELHSVMASSVEEQAKEIEEAEGKETWWQSIKFDFWTAKQKAGNRFHTFFSKLKFQGFFVKLKSFFKFW